jgi:hypothetical protein
MRVLRHVRESISHPAELRCNGNKSHTPSPAHQRLYSFSPSDRARAPQLSRDRKLMGAAMSRNQKPRRRKKPAKVLRPVATSQMPAEALKALAASSKGSWWDEVETEAFAARLELEQAKQQGQTFH